jgi:MFS family permease
VSAGGAAVRETASSLALVFRNRNLRRINIGLAGSLIGDWAYATAVTVWAYGVGGVAAVGIWGVVRLLLLATVTPFAAMLADRYPRKRVMGSADLLRAVLVLAAAGAVLWDAYPGVVFVLATLASLAGSPFRPAQQALLPSLVQNPQELTAANGTGSTLESLAFFLGPAIGGLLLTIADVPAVFLLQVLTFLWSAAMVSAVRVPDHASDAAADDGAASAGGDGVEGLEQATEEAAESFWQESVAGFRTIAAHPDLRLVTGIYCAQTVIAGASIVFGVAIAVDVTGFGPEGVGYLDAILGVGALLGGLVAIGRAGKFRLASDFGVGVLFWALPLLLVSLWPQAAPAFLAMFVIGAANPVVDVNASTILQRLSPDAVLGRVFGALETGLIATMALGALLMPLLISTVGLRWGLAVLAVAMAVVVLPAMRRLRRLDQVLTPPAGLALLEQVAIFAPLDAATREALARRLEPLRVPAGRAIVVQGEVGDRFYLIESGTVAVTQNGEELRREGPGEVFGEIALLRGVPRTATVTAVEDCVLQVMAREDFLGALDGSGEVRNRAEDVAARRLPV